MMGPSRYRFGQTSQTSGQPRASTPAAGCPFHSSIPRRVSKPGKCGQAARTFPSRGDYERHFATHAYVQNTAELWNDNTAVVNIQRHWHTTGQNGCVFAQMIARVASPLAWQSLVTRPERDNRSAEQIEHAINSAIASPECEILSILFPLTVTPDQLAGTIRLLLSVPSIFLVREVTYEKLTTVALRVEISDADKRPLSWLMGFGPFEFFPETRRAPVTEVAIRVKPKPAEQFHRHNPDRTTAHLADFHMGLTDKATERVWQATLQNTRMVLGHESDQFSAAKVTFSVPHALWNMCRPFEGQALDVVESDYPS